MLKSFRLPALVAVALAGLVAVADTPADLSRDQLGLTTFPEAVTVADADRERYWGGIDTDHQYSNSPPLPRKTVGVLVNAKAYVPRPCYGSAYFEYAFCQDGQNYRRFDVPTDEPSNPYSIDDPRNPASGVKLPYRGLKVPKPGELAPWGVSSAPCLVEIDVIISNGIGDSSFVMAGLRRLDGSARYPLEVSRCVAEAESLYRKYLNAQKRNAETPPPDLPWGSGVGKVSDTYAELFGRERQAMYVTWLSGARRLRVVFHAHFCHAAGLGTGVSYTWFGVDFGQAYEFDELGALVKVATLPVRPCQLDTFTGGPCD